MKHKSLSFYSIWDDPHYYGTMTRLLADRGYLEMHRPQDADILVFNGGADIATEIYHEEPVFKGIPKSKTYRDKEEIQLYDEFVGSKFMLGICRGAQLLNCLNGGSLWQHVTNHQMDHSMVDLRSGETFKVTSTHHQMMKPNMALADIIGVSNICKSQEREAERLDNAVLPGDIKDGTDIEVVYYRNTRALCIQGHPEYVQQSRFADWSIELMEEKYNQQLLCKVG